MRRLVIAGSAVAAIAAVGGAALALTSDDPGEPEAVPPPQRLSVTCTPDGIEVSATELVATPAGATVEISRTTPGRTYLNVEGSDGRGGGDPLPATPRTWVWGVPPGEITLSCAPRGLPDESATATVELIDPGHYWRDTTLVEAGCPRDIEPYWNYSGSGDTPRAAVDAMIADMARPQQTWTAAQAEIGYVEAPSQAWLVQRNGKTFMSVGVRPKKFDDNGLAVPAAGYTASAGYLC